MFIYENWIINLIIMYLDFPHNDSLVCYRLKLDIIFTVTSLTPLQPHTVILISVS